MQRLFDAAWPGRIPGCPLVKGHIRHPKEELDEALSLISHSDGTDDLAHRLRTEHPTNRGHKEEWDLRVQDVFAEALGLAWATREFGLARICFDEGRPDIRAANGAWIEVKNLHLSDDYKEGVKAGLEQSPGVYVSEPQFLKKKADARMVHKLESFRRDCAKKFNRLPNDQESRLILLLRTGQFDFDATDEANWTAIKTWASSPEALEHRVEIVVIDRWEWRTPVIHTGFG